MPQFPTQANARRFYGAPGTNHVRLIPPYPMIFGVDERRDGKFVTTWRNLPSFTINKKCADSAFAALSRIASEYSAADRAKLGLNRFSGCYNNRPMRGGTQLSMHAYACAIDFDAQRNQLKWGRTQARLAQPDCEAFWRAWEEQGWLSLGRVRNFDWMHVQAALL